MTHIQGASRDQIILFPETIDDYIGEGNHVQFIEAFAESLDLAGLEFKHSRTKATGRPPYNPQDLLKLYIYGYLNRIRSSRRLEKETHRNLELMWLLKKLTPDHKTIANFRVDNQEAIKKVCREFTILCKKLDLFGAELIAIDGSKFRAQNSKKRNFTRDKLNKTIRYIDEKVNSYISELEENDRTEEENKDLSAKQFQEKINSLKNKKDQYQKFIKEMDESGETQVSLTDPDSRLMMNSQRVEVSYNMQITVDSKHKLILDHEVINTPADQGQLAKMGQRAKEILGVEKIEALADKGYYVAEDIKASLDNGVTPFVPRPNRRRPKADELFSKKQLRYDHKKDAYICPADSELTFQNAVNSKGKTMRLYKTNNCPECLLKQKCTKAASRTVTRWEHEDILEKIEANLQANPEKIRQRQWLVEHPFGTLKRSFDQGYVLLKGIDKVRTEFSLSVLAYNMKRVINIMGVNELVKAVQTS